MSDPLHFAEHTLQEVALLFMALVYTARIIWLLRHGAGGDRQPSTAAGPAARAQRRGILYSWLNVAMPWAMESTRRKKFFYAQFVVFHLGVVAAIGLSFIIPYAPAWLEGEALVGVLRVLIGGAFVVGLLRLHRRTTNPYIRAISSPDDYFSVVLLTVWFGFAFLAAPNPGVGEWVLLTYFWLTAFFLVYVPFSKISHYLYYPFTRYYLGKSLGYRGVYPVYRVTGGHQRQGG